MFGNPWERAQTVEPLYPPGITQPPLILPLPELDLELHRRSARGLGARWRLRRPGFRPWLQDLWLR